MPIIRRKHRAYVTSGICHSIQMTVWYAGRNEIPPCIPDSHLYRMTNTLCHIGTVFPPHDGHIFARNMYRKTINILRKVVHQVGSIYKRLHKNVRSKKHKFIKFAMHFVDTLC